MAAPDSAYPTPGLIRRLGINYKRCLPTDAPCQPIFDDFKRQISSYTHDQYIPRNPQDRIKECEEKPWKAEVCERAEFIVKAANDLSEIEAEESDWRARLEHHIFVRFEYGVECGSCGKKLWEPEIRLSLPGSELEDRRKHRMLCTCSVRYKCQSDLFGSRTSNMVAYKDEVKSHFKRGQRPDRVWGLLFNPYRQKIVDTVCNSLSETPATGPVDISAFAKSQNPLLFPFLVMESKSAVSEYDEQAIFHQTAFVIRRLLLLQKGLSDHPKVTHPSRYGPLVWFMFHRGPIWYVACAYLSGDRPEVDAVRLLTADITDRDDVIRLLLAVDYIADWARDIYRSDIMKQLKDILPDDMMSMKENTEIASKLDRYDAQPEDVNENVPAIDESTVNEGLSDGVGPDGSCDAQFLEFFDTGDHSVRDMSNMHYRLYGLILVEQNIMQFLQLQPDEATADKLAQELLDALAKFGTWNTTMESLKVLEQQWTGRGHDPDFDSSGVRLIHCQEQEPFLIQVRIKSFIESPSLKSVSVGKRPLFSNWQQVHELSYIAISPNALAELKKRVTSAARRDQQIPKILNSPTVAEDKIEDLFGGLRRAPVQYCLATTIDRQVLVSAHDKTREQPILEHCPDAERDIMPHVWDLAKISYTMLKPAFGRSEPEARWLSASSWHGRMKDVGQNRPNGIPAPRLCMRPDEYAVIVNWNKYSCLFLREVNKDDALLNTEPLPHFNTDHGPIDRNKTARGSAISPAEPLPPDILKKLKVRVDKLKKSCSAWSWPSTQSLPSWHLGRLCAFQKHHNGLPGREPLTDKGILCSIQQLMSDFHLDELLANMSERSMHIDDDHYPLDGWFTDDTFCDTSTLIDMSHSNVDDLEGASALVGSSDSDTRNETQKQTENDKRSKRLRKSGKQSARRVHSGERMDGDDDDAAPIAESRNTLRGRVNGPVPSGNHSDAFCEEMTIHDPARTPRAHQEYRVAKSHRRKLTTSSDEDRGSSEECSEDKGIYGPEDQDNTTLIADESDQNIETEDRDESSDMDQTRRRSGRRTQPSTAKGIVKSNRRRPVSHLYVQY